MNQRSCQYPICFTWGDQANDSEISFKKTLPPASSNNPITEILAESEYKCVYDKDNDATAEIYVSCGVLEKAFHLGLDLASTVQDVKHRIKRLEKIPACLMHLFFKDTLLRDACVLKEVGVKNKSALTLGLKLHTARCEECRRRYVAASSRPTTITLDSISRNTYEVKLPLTSPVECLKQLIEDKYKVYPDHQLVICDGRKLEDDVTLEEYNVTNESDLLLLLYQFDNCSFCSYCARAAGKSTIVLKFFDNKITCALHPESTVRDFKEASYRYLHHIHPDLQQIWLKNRELEDDKTMHASDVKDGAKLKVRLRFDRRRCDKCDGALL